MDSVSEKPEDSTYLQRLAALKLLRENIFYAHPKAYAAADIAHDIPGTGRYVGESMGDYLPAKAIISNNVEERKQQIKDALLKIQQTKQSKSALGKTIIHNALAMGFESLPIGFLAGMAFHLVNPRLPWSSRTSVARNAVGEKMTTPRLDRVLHPPNIAAATGERYKFVPRISPESGEIARGPVASTRTILRWPSNFTKNVGRLLDPNESRYRGALLRKSVNDSLYGGLMGAAAGTVYPILGHNMHISSKSMEDARKILEEEPYLSSLPIPEMLMAIRQRKTEKEDKFKRVLKNIGVGAGMGMLTFGMGALARPMTSVAAQGVKNIFRGMRNEPKMRLLPNNFMPRLRKDVQQSAIFGGLLGGGTGAFARNLIEDENQNTNPYPAQSDRVSV
jgi:hypothetical protein